MSAVKKTLVASTVAAFAALAFAQGNPPTPAASDPAVGAGQQSTQVTPMGSTGTPTGGSTAAGATTTPSAPSAATTAPSTTTAAPAAPAADSTTTTTTAAADSATTTRKARADRN
jgi:hypothetical protein